jgi:hypothetical protein
MTIILLIFWFGCGLFNALLHLHKIYNKTDQLELLDLVVASIILILGPLFYIGILLVLVVNILLRNPVILKKKP